jgi:hypothetical protein
MTAYRIKLRDKQHDSIANALRYALLRPEIRIIGALWQIHADEIAFDKLVGFFVSRFKKNPAITWKRDSVIVFPR